MNKAFLEVQGLRLCGSTAGSTVSIPGWGTKILHCLWHIRDFNEILVFIPFSWRWKWKLKSLSHVTSLCDTMDYIQSMEFPRPYLI